ncbi:hypothetical protein L6452_31875 [Arctium lappa]|uniref:Uncharacterized protein n=1 Tax=Arctium lappa TaxID=4217 RepID=A0ACB8Z3W2_ARCLA|nr:hypothetical protein L6452_31875 [Arctium lappa]
MAAAGTPLHPPNNHQWQEIEEQPNSKSYALSGKIMLASIIILFVVVVFLVLLHLYARWYLLRLQRRNHNRRRNRHNRSTRIVFYLDPDRGPGGVPTQHGLDSEVLKSLPLFVYSSENFPDENVPECAVCLSEFEMGETGRVLPKCKHNFHTECIDMWFHSNSTCPLCRSPVEPVESEMTIQQPAFMSEPGSSSLFRSPVHPEHGETTSLADRMKGIDVRIDVPTRMAADNEFRLASPSQGFRSPASRLLALKRILSMNRKSPAVSPSSGVGPSRLPVAAESDLESATEESARLEADNVR